MNYKKTAFAIVAVLQVFVLLAEARMKDSGVESVNLNRQISEEGALKLASDRHVYYRYTKPQGNKPTVVLLNGLIYSISDWDSYYKSLVDQGYGVVQMAYSTQPESLRFNEEVPFYSEMEMTVSGPAQVGLETSDLADEVLAVTDELGVNKFDLLTLSYSSIVGTYLANNHSERLNSITLVSPAVMSSNRYQPYGKARHQFYVAQNAININPLYVPDYYYDIELYQAMRMIMQTQIFTLDLEGVGFENFFNGVYQMARSSKYFDLKEHASTDWPKTTLVLASNEERPLQKDQLRYWETKRETDSESQLVYVKGAPHAIPGARPDTMAEITMSILENSIKTSETTYDVSSKEWLPGIGCNASTEMTCGSFMGGSSLDCIGESTGSSSGTASGSSSFSGLFPKAFTSSN